MTILTINLRPFRHKKMTKITKNLRPCFQKAQVFTENTSGPHYLLLAFYPIYSKAVCLKTRRSETLHQSSAHVSDRFFQGFPQPPFLPAIHTNIIALRFQDEERHRFQKPPFCSTYWHYALSNDPFSNLYILDSVSKWMCFRWNAKRISLKCVVKAPENKFQDFHLLLWVSNEKLFNRIIFQYNYVVLYIINNSKTVTFLSATHFILL